LFSREDFASFESLLPELLVLQRKRKSEQSAKVAAMNLMQVVLVFEKKSNKKPFQATDYFEIS
jgi:hypothetical protein